MAPGACSTGHGHAYDVKRGAWRVTRRTWERSPVWVYTQRRLERRAARSRPPLDNAAIPAHASELGAGGVPAAVPHNVCVVAQLMQHVAGDRVEDVHGAIC